MADGKLTIENFINKFSAEASTYTPIIIEDKLTLNSINLYSDFFIKGMHDKDFLPPFLSYLEKELGSKSLIFITWIEIENRDQPNSSFWLFPVVFYKYNDMVELINSLKSLIKFRRLIINLHNKGNKDVIIDPKIKIGILGDYEKSFVELNSTSDKKELSIFRRKSLIIKENIEDRAENLEIGLITHQYEDYLNGLDILVLPNGFMGNMLYRAWVTMGFVKAVSMVFHDKTHFPLYLGKSILDPTNKLEEEFAKACKGLKDSIKKNNMPKRCALITTNQVDACIRALSGLIQDAKLPEPVMFNLSTGTDVYPTKYPLEVKKQILEVIRDQECDFMCFSIVDLFLERTIDLIQYLKKKMKKIPVIVGGIHAELYPDKTIHIEGVDAICTGEAYNSFIKVLINWDMRFELDMADFWFKKDNGKIKENDTTPFYHGDAFKNVPIPNYSYINYHLLDGDKLKDISSTPDGGPFRVEQHQIGHDGSVIYNSMGGCSNHCSFCNLTAQVELRKKATGSFVRYFRQKPLDMVRNELEALTKYNKKMKFICIMENDFTCRPEKDVREYCELISSICKVQFYTMVSPNTLNENKLKAMIENGLKEINMGIQTNEEFNNKYYDRQIADNHILEIVRIINKYSDKIHPFYDFINFNPEEPDESILKTVTLVRQIPFPFDFVIHHLTLGDELLLYKRLITEKKVPGDEVRKTSVSDYHNLNFDDYKGWKTFYLNLFLEWIAGRHDEEFVGRIPRKLDILKESAFGKRLFSENKIKDIDIDPGVDILMLFTQTLFGVLNAQDNRDILKELNELLPPVRYTNQQ